MNQFLAFLQIAKLLAQLLPVLATLVQSAEAAMPGTPGAAKLEAVRAGLEKAYAVEQGAEVSFEQAWPAVSAIVSSLVTAYNASGMFKKPAA